MINLPVMEPPKSDILPGEHAFRLLPLSMQQDPRFEMTILCELTPYGRTLAPATPERPVYYVSQAGGPQQLGETTGGEKMPENFAKILTRSLSTNGYLPAEGTPQPPSLVLIYHWGSSYEMDIDSRINFPEQDFRQRQERAALIGLSAFDRRSLPDGDFFSRLFPVTLEQERLAVQGQHSLYFTVVSAYDYASLARGERQLVWRAHLTAAAQGVSMRESLPALVLTAGTSFGRDTQGAQFVTRRALRGKVELAPLIMVQNDVTDPGQSTVK